jgi:hypothetical protein
MIQEHPGGPDQSPQETPWMRWNHAMILAVIGLEDRCLRLVDLGLLALIEVHRQGMMIL